MQFFSTTVSPSATDVSEYIMNSSLKHSLGENNVSQSVRLTGYKLPVCWSEYSMHALSKIDIALTEVFAALTWLTHWCGGREQTTRLKCNKFGNKCKHSGIWLLYLESLWKMHSKEPKHAWYWFNNSWNNRRSNFRNLRNKRTFFCSVKPIRILCVNACCVLLNDGRISCLLVGGSITRPMMMSQINESFFFCFCFWCLNSS